MQQEECVPAALLNAMHLKTSITQAAMRHLGGCLPKIEKKKQNKQTAIGTRQIRAGRKPRKGPFKRSPGCWPVAKLNPGRWAQAWALLQSPALPGTKGSASCKTCKSTFCFSVEISILKMKKTKMAEGWRCMRSGPGARVRLWILPSAWVDLLLALCLQQPRQLSSVNQWAWLCRRPCYWCVCLFLSGWKVTSNQACLTQQKLLGVWGKTGRQKPQVLKQRASKGAFSALPGGKGGRGMGVSGRQLRPRNP